MPWARIRLLLVLAATLAAGPSWAQLCAPAADPCVVNADVSVPGDTTIDLGTRALVIGASRTITASGTGTGALTINAGDITFLTGAKIVAPGVGGYGGTVTLQAKGGVTMQANSRIDTTAGGGGDITIIADHADLGGQIRAVATNRDDDAGYVTVMTTGSASIAGTGVDLDAGNRFGSGGSLDVIAGGDIQLSQPVSSKGGLEGGDLSFDAGGDIAIKTGGDLIANATAPLGDGGSVSFRANGAVTIGAAIQLRASGTLLEGAGFGGDLDLDAASAVLSGSIDMSGPGPDGEGGFFDAATTGDITVTGTLVVSGAAQGGGGDVLITAGGNATVGASINLTGGYAGGSFEVTTQKRTDLLASAVVDVSPIAGLAITQTNGDVIITACDAAIAGKLTALGPATLQSIRTYTGGALTVSGTVKGNGGTIFHYRSIAPSFLPGAVVVPAPVLLKDETIACCGDCTTTTTIVGETSTTTTTWTTSTSEMTTTTTTTTLETTTSLETTTTTSTVTTSSSSTVTSSTSSTTVTTVPSCLDEPLEGYDALECVVSLLDGMVTSQPEAALGGRKSAKRLAHKVTKIQALIDKSRTSSKAARLLVKAQKQVVSFQTQIAKLQAHAKLGEPLATDLLDLSGEVTVRIHGVLTPLAH